MNNLAAMSFDRFMSSTLSGCQKAEQIAFFRLFTAPYDQSNSGKVFVFSFNQLTPFDQE